MLNNKKTVLQVATDYPDGSKQITTEAVRNLINATDKEINNITVSIRRVKALNFANYREGDLFIIVIPKIPGGLLCSSFLLLSALFFFIRYRKDLKNIDLVHGHKLCIDGVFAYTIAKLLRCKLVLSIRGTTDKKFYKWNLLSRPLYNKILNECQHLFFVSMWSLPFFSKAAKRVIDSKCYSPLPNICEFTPLVGPEDSIDKFLFVGSLNNATNKGLLKILDCIAKDKKYYIDIFGSGTDQSIKKITQYIADNNIEKYCSLKGKEKKSVIYGQSYIALVLPSYPETFGMVLVEALMSGIPIIASNRAGISGYLPAASYLQYIDERNINEIYNAMSAMVRCNSVAKKNLCEDIQQGKLDIFTKNKIVTDYIAILKGIKL